MRGLVEMIHIYKGFQGANDGQKVSQKCLNKWRKAMQIKGYKCIVPPRGSTEYWVSDNSEFVCAIIRNSYGSFLIILDKSIYQKYLIKKSIDMQGDARSFIPRINNIHNKNHIKLHRLVALSFPPAKDSEVDHITNNRNLVVRENLRECTRSNNRLNSKDKIKKIEKNNIGFYFTDNLIVDKVGKVIFDSFISYRGYEVKTRKKSDGFKLTIKSPCFATEDEWYSEVNWYEKELYGEFRYNPLSDFKHSFYLLFEHYILGTLDKEDMEMARYLELIMMGANKAEHLRKYYDF